MSTFQWLGSNQRMMFVDVTLQPDETPDLDERMGTILKAVTQIREVNHPVDLVIDLRYAQIVAMGNWLMYLRLISTRTPQNLRHVVVIGSRARPLLQRTLDLIDRVQKLPTDSITFVSTLESALTVFERRGIDTEPLRQAASADCVPEL